MKSPLLILYLAIIQILVVICFKQYSIRTYNYIKKQESNYIKTKNNDQYIHRSNRGGQLVIASHNIKHENGYQNITNSYESQQPFQTFTNNNVNSKLNLQNNKQMKNTEDIFINTFTTAKYSNNYHVNNSDKNGFSDNFEDNCLKHNLQKSTNFKNYRNRIKFTALSSSLAAREKTITIQDKLPLPFMNVNLGLRGDWECRYESYVLKPPYKQHQHPVGIIHFLGGAFVGAAPHLTYRYFLEQLCDQGYIVIATPYRLQLDYLSICDHVLNNFGKLTTELNAEYGYYEHNDDIIDKNRNKKLLKRLPIIGLGHSSGAFLHSLISSLFPDIPRVANILISYNNRPASDSVPVFNDLLVPVSTQIARFANSFESESSEKNTNNTSTASRSTLGEAIGFFRRYINLATNIYTESTISPSFLSNEIVPLVRQGLELVDQIPPLLGKLSHGQRQYTPNPSDALECVRRNYRTPYTLLLRFADDLELDQSEELLLAIKEANTIMKMRKNRTYDELYFEMHVVKNGKSTNSLSQNVLSGLSPLKLIPKTKVSDKKRLKLGKMFYGRIKLIHEEIYNFLNISIPAYIENEHDKSIFGKTKNTLDLKKKYGNHFINSTSTINSNSSNMQRVSALNLVNSKPAFEFTPNKSFLINSESAVIPSSKILSHPKPSLLHTTKPQQHEQQLPIATKNNANILSRLSPHRTSPSTTAATEEELEDNFFSQKVVPPKISRIIKTSFSKTQPVPHEIISGNAIGGKKSTSVIPPSTISSILKPNIINNKVNSIPRLNKGNQPDSNLITAPSKSSLEHTTNTKTLFTTTSSVVLKLVSPSSSKSFTDNPNPPATRPFIIMKNVTNMINLKWKLFLEWIKLHLTKIRLYIKKIRSLYFKDLFRSSKRYAIDFDWDVSSSRSSRYSTIFNTKNIQKTFFSGNINIQVQWKNIYNYFTQVSNIDLESSFVRLKNQLSIFYLNSFSASSSLTQSNTITKEVVLSQATHYAKILTQHALIVIFLFLF